MSGKANYDIDWVLGVDLGTSSVKVVALDSNGHPAGFGRKEYLPSDGKRTWEEQDVSIIYSAMCSSVQALIHDNGLNFNRCLSLSLGGALHSILVTDQKLEPITGVMSWADVRPLNIAEDFKKNSDWFPLYKSTGCPPHSMYPIYKIAWLRVKRPEIYSRIRFILSTKAFILYLLTGELIIDHGVASGTGYYDLQSRDWLSDQPEDLVFNRDMLPEIISPWTVINGLKEQAAADLGLPAKCKLVVGTSDAANSNIGAGAVLEHQFTCMIGSSGAIRHITPNLKIDQRARTWCYSVDEENFLVGGAINNGGIVLNWLADKLLSFPGELGIDNQFQVENIDQLAKLSPPGARNLLFYPYLTGERSPSWNFSARGALFGLSLEHTSSDISRAAMEGIGFQMKSILLALEDQGARIKEIRASGGFTHSKFWSQMIATILAKELVVPPWVDTSAVGAGLFALVGLRSRANLIMFDGIVPASRKITPQKELIEFYSEKLKFFMEHKSSVIDFSLRS